MTDHTNAHDVAWLDSGREPSSKPNPAYPNGIDIDISGGAKRACLVKLPYPAKRCGNYVVTCSLCGIVVSLTTAGRLDDPKSIKIACRIAGEA